MATPDGTARTLSKFEFWAQLVSTRYNASPTKIDVIFMPYQNGFLAFVVYFRNLLIQRAVIFSDSELLGFLQSGLGAKTAAINTASPTFVPITWDATQGMWVEGAQPAPLPEPTPPPPETFPELTPEQELAFVAPTTEEAAIIEQQLEAGYVPTGTLTETNAQGEPAPPSPPAEPIDALTGVIEYSVPSTDSPVVPLVQPKAVNPMSADLIYDPLNVAVVDPVQQPPIQADWLKDLWDFAKPIVTDLISTTGDPIPPPTITPQPTDGQLPGVAPELQQQILDLLKGFPPTSLPATGVQGIINMFGPESATTGLPTPQMNGSCAVPQTLVQAQQKVVYTAPKGYVVVTCTGSNGVPVKMAMWKPMAQKLGYWKASKKPPMSASEWDSLKKADRVKNKVKRIAGTAGFKTEVKGRARRRPAATCK